MPVEPLITLHDQLWHALEFGFRTPPLIRLGNRLKLSADKKGWMRSIMPMAPADYPWVMIEVGRRGTHSAFTYDPTFATQEPDFLQQPNAPFDIQRTETVDITCKVDRVTLGTNASPSGPNVLKEAILDDLMRTGPRLGLPDLVVGFSAFATAQRFTRENERPYPGQITTISFTVQMQEDGRAGLFL